MNSTETENRVTVEDIARRYTQLVNYLEEYWNRRTCYTVDMYQEDDRNHIVYNIKQLVMEATAEDKTVEFHVCSPYGDDFKLVLPPTCTVYEGKKAIGNHLNDLVIRSMRNGLNTESSDDDILDSRNSITVDYTLRGTGGLQCIKTMPELCNIKLLCFKCGLQNCPDPNKTWLCESMFLCLFSKCGFVEMKQTQFCCLGPCTKPALNMTTTIPAALVINLLCFKCGVQNFPDCRHEDLITECGLKDMCSVFQLFCCMYIA